MRNYKLYDIILLMNKHTNIFLFINTHLIKTFNKNFYYYYITNIFKHSE